MFWLRAGGVRRPRVQLYIILDMLMPVYIILFYYWTCSVKK